MGEFRESMVTRKDTRALIYIHTYIHIVHVNAKKTCLYLKLHLGIQHLYELSMQLILKNRIK